MKHISITLNEAKVLSAIINMEFNDGCDWVVDGIRLSELQNKLKGVCNELPQ